MEQVPGQVKAEMWLADVVGLLHSPSVLMQVPQTILSSLADSLVFSVSMFPVNPMVKEPELLEATRYAVALVVKQLLVWGVLALEGLELET